MDLLDDFTDKPVVAPKRLRVLACLIDCLFYLLATYPIWAAYGVRENGDRLNQEGYGIGLQLSGLPALAVFLIGFALFPLIEGLTGQTIGQRLLKIKVVKEDLSPTTLGSSFIRHLFDGIDFFFLIGLIVASSNKKGQRIGDLVARTRVIRK